VTRRIAATSIHLEAKHVCFLRQLNYVVNKFRCGAAANFSAANSRIDLEIGGFAPMFYIAD
jgi:hypothetical protein